MFKFFCILFISGCLISSCGNNNAPDVSDLKIDLNVKRFEQDLFSADTNNILAAADQLQAKYKGFGENFFIRILNADPTWQGDTLKNYINGFVSAYRPVFDSSQKLFNDFDPYFSEIKKGLQYVHHYFPTYKLPANVITYIGPFDGYGDLLDDNAIVVGLHHHLGENFSAYKTSLVQETYPDYISRRFTPEYISINAMKNIYQDMFPETNNTYSLVEQMVEQGKMVFALEKLLPGKEKYLLIGYTEKQLKDAYDRENVIWDFFLQNNLLQNTDYNLVKNYIGDSPKTQELGEAAPGNIGTFSGLQIVKKYMADHKEVSLQQLLKLPPGKIYAEAKYKP